MKTRVASGKVMNAIAPKLPSLMGGSADLDPSTHTALKGAGDFEYFARASGDTQGSCGGGWSYAGCNLHFGVRELVEAENGRPEIILIATGSEVSLIVEARMQLQQRNIQARLVSMPSWELFDAQAEEYRRSVLPPLIRARLAVEAGATQGWLRYVGDLGDVVGLDHFGASAPAPVLMREYGFTVENVCKRALALLEKNHA